MTDKTSNRVSGLERHLQTVLVMAVVAMLGWAGNKASVGLETLTRLEERIEVLKVGLDKLDGTESKLQELTYRVQSIERQLEVRYDRANH